MSCIVSNPKVLSFACVEAVLQDYRFIQLISSVTREIQNEEYKNYRLLEQRTPRRMKATAPSRTPPKMQIKTYNHHV